MRVGDIPAFLQGDVYKRQDMGLRDITTRLHDLMVDEHITFGSIGVSTAGAVSLDYIYPGARGTSTRKLPDGFPLEHIYSNEYHPVRKNGGDCYAAVSYTHLDVYKRQAVHRNKRNRA